MIAALAVGTLSATARPAAAEVPVSQWSGLTASQAAEIPELTSAAEKFKAGDYTACLSQLEIAAAKHAYLPNPRLLLGRMFLVGNQTLLGRAELERVAVAVPDLPETHLTFGQMALRESRLSDAELQLNKAVSLPKPTSWPEEHARNFAATCSSSLAELAERRRQWTLAKQRLEEAIRLSPRDSVFHQRLGRACFELGQLDACNEALAKAGELDPTLAPIPTLLGLLYSSSGKFDQAEPLLRDAANAQPPNAKALSAYGSWLLTRERTDEALKFTQKALAAAPKDRDVRFLSGAAARYAGKPAEAEPYFNEIVTDSPSDVQATLQLAAVLAEQNDPQKRQRALNLAGSVIKQDPNNRDAVATLGWCHFQLGNLEEAERFLQASLISGQGSPAAAYYLAKVFHARGRPQPAKQLLEAALKTNQPFPDRAAAKAWQAELAK